MNAWLRLMSICIYSLPLFQVKILPAMNDFFSFLLSSATTKVQQHQVLPHGKAAAHGGIYLVLKSGMITNTSVTERIGSRYSEGKLAMRHDSSSNRQASGDANPRYEARHARLHDNISILTFSRKKRTLRMKKVYLKTY